ncbi:hypothetical protein FSP39_016684 [Pinctada imbricata]|uniref:U3 small nucleolar RNA-associated protein 15 homolog n=1 Tax=Pinctada imbricata TaxID=66713 RepID=A0AA88Y4X1_PINIB|nr:hypothetical protein FSP39_016684 [Pinctada imbricata]
MIFFSNPTYSYFKVPVIKKEYGAISNIEFCPVDPHSFAVTNSSRVQVYSPKSLQIIKTISRFKEVAHCGSFRDDGRLLVAGGDEGVVRLFDWDKNSLLRVFKGHIGSVHVTRFLRDRVRIFSGSDDNSISVWDIPSEKEVISYREHEDYVRCGVSSSASSDIILTGSYDHTVKMYDTRAPDSVMTVRHGHPVESVLMFPNGGIFLSAGGNVVKVWDALGGGRLLTTLYGHHKTVTCLNFCSNYQRLLTGSVDRHVKIYDVSTYQMVHTLDIPGSVLSAAVSPDDSLLVVGTVEGLLSIQKRKVPEDLVRKRKKGPSFTYSLKGKTYTPHKSDHVVEHKRREQLTKYDKFFRKFNYSRALDASLDIRVRSMHPEVTVSVIQELIKRDGIRSALAGRDEKSLTIIVRFIQKNIGNPRLMPILVDVTNLLLEIYSCQIGHCSAVDTILLKLKETVDQEIMYMKQFMELMGSMDTVFAAVSQLDTPTHDNSDSTTVISQSTLLPSKDALAAS